MTKQIPTILVDTIANLLGVVYITQDAGRHVEAFIFKNGPNDVVYKHSMKMFEEKLGFINKCLDSQNQIQSFQIAEINFTRAEAAT